MTRLKTIESVLKMKFELIQQGFSKPKRVVINES